MDALNWALVGRIARLLLPALLGVILASLGRPKSPRAAIEGLNVFALYVAFPALVVRGLMDWRVEMPGQLSFYVMWPIALVVALGGLGIWRRVRGDRGGRAGMLALSLAFGNVAYLGLPYVLALAGESVKGAATLAVSIHVVGAVTVGPWFYMRWASDAQQSLATSARRLLSQPLFWAPWVGLGLRWLSIPQRQTIDGWISPFASSAAVVALFMLGLYLYDQRAYFRRLPLALWGSLLMRLCVMPMLVLCLSVAMVQFGWLVSEDAVVHVMLASMPVAITTFAIANDVGKAPEEIASLIVWSTGASLITLPLWWMVARAVLV